jgi:ubiquinone/menaquinone biosynthesis C-methylase UbiE
LKKKTSKGKHLAVLDRQLNVDGLFLIDAGCGDMHLSRELASRGASVLALDPDPIQAEKNRQLDTIANVGFVETGADSIPVEPAAIDGVLFPYSLHHVPNDLMPAVFDEVFRILKPDGFVYIIEPVAQGGLNEVTSLFHDEAKVREQAQQAIDNIARPAFSNTQVIDYSKAVVYDSWERFAKNYISKSFNTQYSEADILNDKVKQSFLEQAEKCNFNFESPMRVTHLSGYRPGQSMS